MAASLPFKVSSSSIFLESSDLSRPRAASTVCNALRNYSGIPNLGTFSKSRSRIEPLKDLPFILKTENDLLHYCSTLEGDDCYQCWTAYFELKDLEEEVSKEQIESLMRQAGDVKNLVRYIHSASAARKYKKKSTVENNNNKGVETAKQSNSATERQSERSRAFPVPDELPKSLEEIEEEEKVRMQDSPHTKLLRRMGKHAAWFTPRPDHETD